MGLFKEKFCAKCGKKVKPLFNVKLKDGNYICMDCFPNAPSYLTNRLDQYTLEKFNDLIDYVNYSKNELSKIFTETHSYKNIHLDSEHGLFYIDELTSENLILKLENVENFDFMFSPEEYKEGFLNDKVYGDVLLGITVNVPFFVLEKKIAKHVKTKAKTSFFGKKVEYEIPQEVSEFNYYFEEATIRAIHIRDFESTNNGNTYQESGTNSASELQQAMSLFMIDDLNNVSLDEIKKQRNRLVSIYHPDKNANIDEKFMKKINNAFEILKKAKGN